jgi:hypothetical protein
MLVMQVQKTADGSGIRQYLVGGLEHFVPIYIGNNNPN